MCVKTDGKINVEFVEERVVFTLLVDLQWKKSYSKLISLRSKTSVELHKSILFHFQSKPSYGLQELWDICLSTARLTGYIISVIGRFKQKRIKSKQKLKFCKPLTTLQPWMMRWWYHFIWLIVAYSYFWFSFQNTDSKNADSKIWHQCVSFWLPCGSRFHRAVPFQDNRNWFLLCLHYSYAHGSLSRPLLHKTHPGGRNRLKYWQCWELLRLTMLIFGSEIWCIALQMVQMFCLQEKYFKKYGFLGSLTVGPGVGWEMITRLITEKNLTRRSVDKTTTDASANKRGQLFASRSKISYKAETLQMVPTFCSSTT